MATSRSLNVAVTAHHPETGASETFPAGTKESDLPSWTADAITNPDVWESDDVDLGPVPGSSAFGPPWVDDAGAPVPSIDATQEGTVTVGGLTTDATPATGPTREDELNDMTVSELRDYAAARDVALSSSDNKSEIVAKILAS